MDHPGNISALVNWLEALADPKMRRSMGAEAQEQTAFLTVERNVKLTILSYKKVLEEKT
jgi:hypothetical protein